MKLCVDARLLHASGIGTFLKNLLPYFDKELDLVVLHKEGEDVPYAGIPMKSRIYTIAEQWELFRKIPKCDLFFSPHYNIPLLPIRAKKRVVTIHDAYPLAFAQTLTFAQKAYAKLFFAAAMKYSDQIVTVSEFSKQELQKYCPSQKPIHVIPNTLSPQFTYQEGAKDEEYLLCVGNVKPHKNLLRLVQAYARLMPKEKLLIIGKKEGLLTRDETVLDFVEQHLKNRIIFTGYVPDKELPALYSGAKLFIFPSYYEGFGFPPLEAMACHCPALVARAASLPEVCGDAVEYVDPLSVDSIYEGMKSLLQNPSRRLELVEKGKERAAQYHPESSAQRYIELLC